MPTVSVKVQAYLPFSSRSFPHAYVLVIGIDKYRHLDVLPLHSAVSDASDMVHFLHKEIGVPDSRIRSLTNSEATRDEMILALQDLATNNDIEPDDPIIVYFAGHGSVADTTEKSPEVQMLCPYDFIPRREGTECAQGIPYHTIRDCLEKTYKAKRNSIVSSFPCSPNTQC